MKLGCLIIAIAFIAAYAISWAITCGIIALVCYCFGWAFNWLIATGIWLVMCLISAAFK